MQPLESCGKAQLQCACIQVQRRSKELLQRVLHPYNVSTTPLHASQQLHNCRAAQTRPSHYKRMCSVGWIEHQSQCYEEKSSMMQRRLSLCTFRAAATLRTAIVAAPPFAAKAETFLFRSAGLRPGGTLTAAAASAAGARLSPAIHDA